MNNLASPAKPKVALIAGPTASGKSALAVRLAEITGGVVINADASQVYADLRILSARPDDAEMARAPHRLFGYRDAAAPCSAAEWAADARAAIAAAHTADRLPILVGGTGLYLRTLLKGIAPVPDIDPAIRETVRALSTDRAYAALAVEDPQAHARLHPRDNSRIARALEVVRTTGKPLHQWQQQLSGGIEDDVSVVPAILLPPRAWLRTRCDLRFDRMIASGGIDEVRELLARDLARDLPAMRAIGVPEIIAWCEGRIDHAMMADLAKAATRQYAKRQHTWFRHQLPTAWRRTETQLDDDFIHELAIILHREALTR